ncbi:hexose carrier protein [Hortaea werneckii]|nr:hexose carrier protein [Hortaea werneckii]
MGFDQEKPTAMADGASNVEHRETPSLPHAKFDTGSTALAENAVAYGPPGVRGLFSSGPFILCTAFLASMGGFSFGYDQGVISVINTLPQFHAVIPRAETAFGKGFTTGMLLLGAFVGCWFYPYIADRWSRKKALLVSSIIFIIGGIMMTAAYDYGTLVAGRAIGGVGTGTLALGAPLYISEVSPPHLRGTLLVLESPWGGLLALPFALQNVSALLLGVMIQFFPYSPRWLAMKDRHEDCLASLCKLRGLPTDDNRVQAEYRGIITEVRIQNVMLERRHPGISGVKLEVAQWLHLLSKKRWRRTAAGAGVTFFQQFEGVNAFIYYAPTLFVNIGQSEGMALILSGVFNCLQLVGVLIAFLLIDRVGRRPLAIFGSMGMTTCYVIIAGLLGIYAGNWSNNTSAGWACVAMAFLFIIIYGASYSPLGWALPPEIFPISLRSKGVALSVSINWLSNFIVGIATPPMFEDIGFGTYVFFACFCALAAIWAFLLVPETMNKTLEQVDEAFGDFSGQEEQDVMWEIMGAETVSPRKNEVA